MQKYTVFDISEKLNVDPETVRRWIRSGELKSTMNSKKKGYIVTEQDFIEFCNNTPRLNARIEDCITREVNQYRRSKLALQRKLQKLIKERDEINRCIDELTTLLGEG